MYADEQMYERIDEDGHSSHVTFSPLKHPYIYDYLSSIGYKNKGEKLDDYSIQDL